MASTRTIVPVDVRKVVSRTMVRSRYRLVTSASAVGRMAQCPASLSRIRANTAGLSNRGKQSQSTDPSVLTRAAE
jgi:hypothetical protein